MAGLNYVNINPKDCLDLSFEQSMDLLCGILGRAEMGKAFGGQVCAAAADRSWCKTVKIIGINPRITGTYWGIVKYAMTFPENAVHIMPLWETGDRGSLYVQASWRLNREFLDEDLVRLGYETPEKQLKLVVNVLHALGKFVGFDALPHVDNFAETVILNPGFFEWVKLNEAGTEQLPGLDYNLIYKEVEKVIEDFAGRAGIFESDEKEREAIIFPSGVNRLERRIALMNAVRSARLEPIPVTEHAPMRPVVFDRMENGHAVFKVENKDSLAKIIGCITPYKWYKIDHHGYPLKNAAENEVWDYYINKINGFQKEYNFDFLRADMAHNQISHSHCGEDKDSSAPEMWAKLKDKIQKTKPHFAFLGEAFYNYYYISGIQDMLNKKMDIVLGDMNFKFLNKEYLNFIDDFLNPFRQNFQFHPCMCTFSNDGDLPEHNQCFQSQQANEVRFFISLFLNLPSYTGIGYELRNLHPCEDDEFSHHYVKHQPKPYKFGSNDDLFNSISNMRVLYVKYKDIIDNNELVLLETNSVSIAWVYVDAYKNPLVLFAANLDPEKDSIQILNFAAKDKIEDISVGQYAVFEFNNA